jgi:hypothetical protein
MAEPQPKPQLPANFHAGHNQCLSLMYKAHTYGHTHEDTHRVIKSQFSPFLQHMSHIMNGSMLLSAAVRPRMP